MAINDPAPIRYETITVKYREHGEYEYFASFLVSFGYRGRRVTEATDPGLTLARLWADGELIYDYDTGRTKPGVQWYIRKGWEDQEPVDGYELAYRGQILVCFVDYPLGESASLPTISAEFIDALDYTVADAMETLAEYAGYDPSDIQTIGLDNIPLLGYLIDGTTTLQGIAQTLGYLYDFTMVEVAGTVTFARKYTGDTLTVDEILAEGDLAVLNESGNDYRIDVIERSASQSLPYRISAQYFDIDANYDVGDQMVQRNGGPIQTYTSSADVALQLPITAEGSQLRAWLYDVLYRSWKERNGHALRLPPSFLALDPGDTIVWDAYGATYTGQLLNTTMNADFSTSVALVEKSATYEEIEGNTQPPATPNTHVGYDTVNVVFFDHPDTAEDQVVDGFVNVRVAAGSFAPNLFNGARVDLAPVSTGQPAWTTAVTFSAEEEVPLAALRGIPAIDADTLEITAYNMTAARLTAGIGQDLAVGSGSTSEIVNYTGFNTVSPGVYELTGVTRGLFGSDLAINAHTSGEGVAFVIDMKIIQFSVEDFEAQTNFLYRAVATGMPDSEATSQLFKPSGNSRKPYSPNNVAILRGDDGDITITWDEDVRFSGEPDSVYSIDFYEDDWSTLYRRANNIIGTSYTYYIEEQIIDGRNEDIVFNLLVYQINASHVGRGFAGGGVIQTPVIQDLEGSIDADPEFTADLDISGSTILRGKIDADPEFTADLEVTTALAGTIDADPTFGADLQIGNGEVELIGQSSMTYLTDNEYSLTIPAETLSGDLLIACIGHYNNALTPPAGWTLVARQHRQSGAGYTVSVYERPGVDDIAGDTEVWSQSSVDFFTGQILALRHNNGLPMHVDTYVAAAANTQAFGVVNFPGLTATAKGQISVVAAISSPFYVANPPTTTEVDISSPWLQTSPAVAVGNRMGIAVFEVAALGSVGGTMDTNHSPGGGGSIPTHDNAPVIQLMVTATVYPPGGTLEAVLDVDPTFSADLEVEPIAPQVIDSTFALRDTTLPGVLSVNVPTHMAGDLLIAIISTGDDTGTYPFITAADGGWTLLDDNTCTSPAGGRYASFYRVATGSEPASYDFNVLHRTIGVITSIRGQNAIAPFDDVNSNVQNTQANNFNLVSVTATTAPVLMLAMASVYNSSAQLASGSITFPGSMTQHEMDGTGSTNGVRMLVASEELASAGPIGTYNFTVATSNRWWITAAYIIKA